MNKLLRPVVALVLLSCAHSGGFCQSSVEFLKMARCKEEFRSHGTNLLERSRFLEDEDERRRALWLVTCAEWLHHSADVLLEEFTISLSMSCVADRRVLEHIIGGRLRHETPGVAVHIQLIDNYLKATSDSGVVTVATTLKADAKSFQEFLRNLEKEFPAAPWNPSTKMGDQPKTERPPPEKK